MFTGELYTIEFVANYLGIEQNEVYDKCHDSVFIYVKTDKGYLISGTSVITYLKQLGKKG